MFQYYIRLRINLDRFSLKTDTEKRIFKNLKYYQNSTHFFNTKKTTFFSALLTILYNHNKCRKNTYT